MSQETLVSVLIGLVLTAYGFIFNSILSRIKKVEERPECDASSCRKRFEKIENEQSNINPVFLEIKERLAGIEATLKFLTGERKIDN